MVRTERRGVPIEGTLRGGAFDLTNRVRRLVRRDRTWLVRVKKRSDDPSGPDVFVQTVEAESEVAAALDAVLGRIRAGALEVDPE